MHTEWKRVDQGGLEDIAAWCKEHPERRLIWIDTLGKIRPIVGRSEQAYAADYRAIEGLQKLAGEYQVGVVLNHHLRKASSEDDAFDDVSGTLGLTGAADTIIVMKRHAGMVKVFVRGRDIEEAEFAAEFNKDTCRWRLVGVADDVFRSHERQAVLTALKETARPMSVPEIMAATERRDRKTTENLLYKMEKGGEIKHAGRGRWAHPDLSLGDPPSKPGGIGGKDGNGRQPIDIEPQKDADKSIRNPSSSETGWILDGLASEAKPLTDNENIDKSIHPSNPSGSEKAAPETCAQCGASDPGPLWQVMAAEGPVWLHTECRRFWLRANPQPKGAVIACVRIAEVVATGTLR